MSSVFKTIEGRDKIREYYNHILSAFPIAQSYVDTSFGKTFVLEVGNKDNQAMILLHGSCSNSAAWFGDMAALAKQYHVYAVDILGEPGNSEDNRLDIESDEYSRWLSEVIDELEINKAVIIGNSMGGWMALHFAAAYPERTAALVLMAPSGIISPKQAFIEQTADIVSDSSSVKKTIDDVMDESPMPKEVIEFMTLIMENFIPITGELPVLTDEQMSAINMPLLYIAGTHDVTMDVEEVVKRLTRLVPQTNVRLVEGAHVIMTAADQINSFLAKEL